MKCIYIFIILTGLFTTTLSQVTRSPEITVDELRAHIKYLSSNELEGRLTGTKGADLAAEYIAKEFKVNGLIPLGDQGTYFQGFDFISEIVLGLNNNFCVKPIYQKKKSKQSNLSDLSLSLNKDFRPIGFSSSGSFSGNLVFAGYGIEAPDKNYNDYKDMDVKDKAVIVFRYAPPGDSAIGNFDQFASLHYKTSKAKERGAKAILFVTGPVDSEKDELIKLTYDRSSSSSGILAINITQALADTLLKKSSNSIKDLQNKILQSKASTSFEIKDCTVSINVDLKEIHAQGKNVVGYLEGNDPVLKNEVMVIGAHYDHLGKGGENSGSLKPDTIAIHPGADDNASGTSGLLELSQFFANHKDRLKRSMLFLSFTGEELGLLGSGYYIKHPILPLDSTIAMLNMDMIGHMKNRSLIVFGSGTSSLFDSLTRAHNSDSTFNLKLNTDGYGPSDHSSFYAKKIPVLHFFTDLNEFYHRPIDTYDIINYDGQEKVVKYIASIAFDLNQISQKPKYIAMEKPKTTGAGGRNTRVFVGTIPDFGDQSEGMKISGVREGSPAAKAGLQGGDVITKFGKVDVKNIYDYTYALGEYKAGDTVDVVVKRGKESMILKVTLEKRN